MEVKLKIENPRPYFAELPYYLWGEVNYDSDGDCKYPTDRNWNYFYLRNRNNSETVTIDGQGVEFLIQSDNDKILQRTILFLKERSNSKIIGKYEDIDDKGWNHKEAIVRTIEIKSDFENDKLQPFDDTVFWGSWKWTGKYATDFTWSGRWIMNSILKNDKRAVCICAEWLKEGTYNQKQSEALRYALEYLTTESFQTDKQWVNWYYGRLGILKGKGQKLYPEPDYKQWQKEK